MHAHIATNTRPGGMHSHFRLPLAVQNAHTHAPPLAQALTQARARSDYARLSVVNRGEYRTSSALSRLETNRDENGVRMQRESPK